tara:strand:- start:118 stop:315 length:198 start_codon:yes stop_codon:yes gene_type:complete
MNAKQFATARRKLGLSQADVALMFKVASDRTVRRWEMGERDIPGPVIVLMRWLCDDVRPSKDSDK